MRRKITDTNNQLQEEGVNYGQYCDSTKIYQHQTNPLDFDFTTAYIDNIWTDPQNKTNANYGAFQIRSGSGNLPNSGVYTGRSMGSEYKSNGSYIPELQNTEARINLDKKRKKNTPKHILDSVDPQFRTPKKYRHYQSGESVVDSERVVTQQCLDDYITQLRQDPKMPIPYDPYADHSVDNMRRPSSPSHRKYRSVLQRKNDSHTYNPASDYETNRLQDKDPLHALHKLSDQQRKYEHDGKLYTYAQMTKKWIKQNSAQTDMLSEAAACDKPRRLGCKQWLPQIQDLSKGDNYVYTSLGNRKKDREKLFKAYDEY